MGGRGNEHCTGLSVLVAHGEKDSQFLLNNAMNILSTLHTSLTGATDRDKAERRSRANSLITLESRGGDSTTSEVLMLTSKQGLSDTKEIALDSTMSTSVQFLVLFLIHNQSGRFRTAMRQKNPIMMLLVEKFTQVRP